MSPATDNRSYTGDGTQLGRDVVGVEYNGPIKGGQSLKVGCLAGQLFTDTNNPPFLYDYVGDGTMRCVGFVTLGADATGQADNSRPTRAVAETGTLIDKNAGGGSAIGPADLFQLAYGVDNQTCSKLATDGPVIGQITGIDRQTGNPVILIDPVTAVQVSVRQHLAIAIPLAGFVVGGGTAAALTPGFAGRILGVTYSTTLAGAGAGATMAITLKIGGTLVTGGGATLTLANQTQGAELAGAAVTAANKFTASQQITVVNASGTVFTAGQVQVNILVG